MLQTLRPVLWFENTQESDDCLTGCIPDHCRMVAESLKNGTLDVVCDLGGCTGDESGIVLEQIASNRPDTILFVWEGTKDIDEISDVLWSTRKVVKFLSFRISKIS